MPQNTVHIIAVQYDEEVFLLLLAAVCVKVRFQLEQTREGLQRQLAATDGQMHVLQARLEDSQAEQQVHRCSHPCVLHHSTKSPTLSLDFCIMSVPTCYLGFKSACPVRTQCSVKGTLLEPSITL